MLTFLRHIELNDLDNLDVFAVFDESELIMKEKTFLFTIHGMGLSKDTIESARRVLVEEQPRQEVIKAMGMNESHLSTTIKNIMKRLKKRLDENELVMEEFLISKKYLPMFEALRLIEGDCIDEMINKKSRRKRRKKVEMEQIKAESEKAETDKKEN